MSVILAIEPDRANFDLLSINTAPYPNVLPIRAAIWHRPEILLVRNPEAESWAFQMREASEEEKNATIGLTISELLKWSGSPLIDILKLDIEGAEKDIFEAKDSDYWLDRVRQIQIETHDRIVPGCQDAVERIAENRFARSAIDECTILNRVSQPSSDRPLSS